jgi:hypothetical protein
MQTLKFRVLLLAGAVLVAICGGCASRPYYDGEVVFFAPGTDVYPCPPSRTPHGRPSATGTSQPTQRDTPLDHGQTTSEPATRTRELRPEVRVRVPRPEPERTPERVAPGGSTRMR